ncbi:unnamed protein product [Peniophora sp. CBMAI 1063]|nr:unnamed protein product [Peniophora sp. CBMAI 1063]
MPVVDLSDLEPLDPFQEPWDAENKTLYITATLYGTGPNDPLDMDDHDRLGQDRRRLEINMKMPKPHAHMSDLELEEWADKYVEDMTNDLKSSQRWLCLFCHEPARTIATHSVPTFEPIPLIFYWIHALCDVRHGPCSRKYIEYSHDMHDSVDRSMIYHPRKAVEPQKYPRFGTCAACADEHAFGENMVVCPRCKVARYCSERHLRASEQDHARFCTAIRGIQWTWR